jgi:hypothetical protein
MIKKRLCKYCACGTVTYLNLCRGWGMFIQMQRSGNSLAEMESFESKISGKPASSK